MDEEAIRTLMAEKEVSAETARSAMEMVGEDLDEARELLDSRNIVLKGRFSSQETTMYGLFCMELEVSPPGLEQLSVLVGNDRAIGNVSIQQNRDDLLESIHNVNTRQSRMGAVTDELREALTQEFAPPSEEWMEFIREQRELELQDRLKQLITDVVDDDHIVLTLELEERLPEHYSDGSEPEADEEKETEQESAESEEEEEEDSTIVLKCDVKVSPVLGTAVSELSRGDLVFVRINKGQKEHRRLIDVIDRFRDEATGMVPAPAAFFRKTGTGKVELMVRFGENVFGKTLVGEDMHILTPDTGESSSSDNFLLWVAVPILLIAMGLVLLYIAFML